MYIYIYMFVYMYMHILRHVICRCVHHKEALTDKGRFYLTGFAA